MRAFSVTTYAALRRKVHEVLLLGQREIENAKVRTYWETGRLINEYLRRSKNSNQGYGKKIVTQLAGDLGFGETVLYRCMRFAEQFPILAARPKLSWAHYRALIAVPDEKKRCALAEEASREEWSSRELGIEVRNLLWDERAKAADGKPPELLPVPVLGPFYTYKITNLDEFSKTRRIVVGARATTIQPESIHSEVPSRVLDVGFSSKKDMSLFPACRLPAGAVVTSVKDAKGNYALKGTCSSGFVPRRDFSSMTGSSESRFPSPESLLYTYKAFVKQVIDGDTIKVELDIGFGDWHGETIRLKGIDCPEMDTSEGRSAKKFVENALQGLEFVTVKTFQSDKYDRYLGDVFLEKGFQSADRGLQPKAPDPGEGLSYLNNLLLEKGHAVRVRY